MKDMKEHLIVVGLLVLALAMASQIDTITGMATSTTDVNTSLAIFSDTDSFSRMQGEIVFFYANYTNLTGWPITDNSTDNGTCLIQFGDSSQVFNMSFNMSGQDIYRYNRTFPIPTTYSWNVTCLSNMYGTLSLADTSLIDKTYCNRTIVGDITLTSDLMMSNGTAECVNDGITVNASNIKINCSGNAIEGMMNGSGIIIDSFSNITIVECDISSFTRGLSFLSASGSTARNNSIHDNSYGIHINSSIGNLFYHNIFSSNQLHVYSNTVGNAFNTTSAGKAQGNNWDNTASLMIFDSDSDGYGDFGHQYPYNRTHGGTVSDNVSDWGPVTSNLDSDNDGSPDTEDCAPFDPTLFTPRDDIRVTRNSTLCPGTYYINDTLRPGVIWFNTSNLVLSCGDARLVGTGSGTGIHNSHDNNTITGCRVSGYYHGIRLTGAGRNVITNITVWNNTYSGLTLDGSSDNNVTDIKSYDNDNSGIFLTTSSYRNSLWDIDSYDNYVGVYLYYADNTTIWDADLYDNNWYGLFAERVEHSTVDDTTIYGNQRGLYLSYSNSNNLTNVSSYDNSAEGMLLWFSDANRLYNVSASDNTGSGLVVWTARDNLIMNSTIESNKGYGIQSYISLYSKVYNTTIYNNTQDGVYVDSAHNNSILDNNITDNRRGIFISASNHTVVRWNDIIGSGLSGVLVDQSYDVVIENNTITGNTGTGVNISDNSSVSIFNNTITGNSLDGIWIRDASMVNITNNTVCLNTGHGLFFVNSVMIPSYPAIRTSNTLCTDNTLGMLSFNWYAQVRTLDRLGNNASDVEVNLTRTDQGAPQYITSSDSGALTPYMISTQYVIDNTATRQDKTYNITARKGDFYGLNSTDITENRINPEGDEIFITLDQALPPRVWLKSPGFNTSTSVHDVTFICNASHEGGLVNISLYHNVSGNMTRVATNNLTGTDNQTSFTVNIPDKYFGWNCNATSAYSTSGLAAQDFVLTVYTPPPTGGGTGSSSDEPPSEDESPSEEAPSEEAPSEEEAPAEEAEEAPAEEAPAEEAEAEAPAVEGEEAPDAAELVQTAALVSCEEEVSVVEEDISLEDLYNIVQVPEGYFIIAKPFKASCRGGETFITSVMVPDIYEDVQLLSCVGAGCTSKTATYTTKLCPGNDPEIEVREETEFDVSAAAVRVSAVSANLSEGDRSLESGGYSVAFDTETDVSISTATENQPEPANKNVRIVGNPMVIKFKEQGSGSDIVNVTIPYVVGPDEDELSIAVYAKSVEENKTKWLYVGGKVDMDKGSVTATVNVSAYVQDGEVILAPITIFCPDCGEEAEFNNEFMPVPNSGNAIILLHGLWGSGVVWESLVSEFRQTNQPYQLWTFSYLASKGIEQSAEDLANYMEANAYRWNRIYIIGYSLGGLISQTTLRYAYDENEKEPGKYTFVDKLSKVLIIGTPNGGSPVANYLDKFLSEYINSEASSAMPLNDAIKDLLLKGRIIERIPNVDYYAIAGTTAYPFMERLGLSKLLFKGEKNDGLVSVSSVQNAGEPPLDEECINYWSRPVVHTLLIDDRLVQKIMGQIIAKDFFNELAEGDLQTNLFGYSDYFELDIESCSPDSLYVVIGKKKPQEEIDRPAYCACGNGVCDGLETAETCPDDCLVEAKPLIQRIIERSLSILALLIALFMVGGFVYEIYLHRKRKRAPPPLPPGFNVIEDKVIPPSQLNYLGMGARKIRDKVKAVHEKVKVVRARRKTKRRVRSLEREKAEHEQKIDAIAEGADDQGVEPKEMIEARIKEIELEIGRETLAQHMKDEDLDVPKDKEIVKRKKR